MSIFFLKQMAKMKLQGIYTKALCGQLICYIPAYLVSMLVVLITTKLGGNIWGFLISLIFDIFIIDIFTVGYMSSLISASTNQENLEKKYDINLVLSGFSEHYPNILKITFLRRLYVMGWGLLSMLPLLVAVGVIACLTVKPETLQAFDLIVQLAQSPTNDMLLNVSEYIAQNCMYIVYILSGASVMCIVLLIPYVRKSYMYKMIPMIMAENPYMPSSMAFLKTREIMQGYRMKYFLLELSFIGVLILATIIASFISITSVMYIIMAFAMVYINMTFVQFYLVRTRTGGDSGNVEMKYNSETIREDETE